MRLQLSELPHQQGVHPNDHMGTSVFLAADQQPVLCLCRWKALAHCLQVGARLTVLNLNQQTDSADLLGGFKPSEPGDTLQPLLATFQDLVRR